MSEIEIVTRHSGQEVLVFRCDQQLYRVVLGVIGPVQKEKLLSRNQWNALGDELYRVHREISG